MSGSNSKGGGRSGNSSVGGGGSEVSVAGGGAKRGGWEEAGGEFYQESYPGGGIVAGGGDITTLLPSKHLRTMVRRMRPAAERRQSTAARGTAVSRDVLVSMLPDLSENLSTEETTWEEIMQIKAMPVPMSQKRELKAQLQSATKLRLQGFEQLKWQQRKVWQTSNAKIKETFKKLELWKNSFKTIEGYFGTGVVSYFYLIKWLLFLNLAISALLFFFVILPSVLFQEYLDPSDEECVVSLPNSTECCSQDYANTTWSEITFLDVIQGTQWMERTFLFYGIYSNRIFGYYVGGSNQTVAFYKDTTGSKLYYDLPLSYILIPLVYFLLSLIAIVKSAAKGFKERLVEGEGQFYQYCNIIFGGWDFCIHNEKSANIKHKALYNEMKGCLEEERMKEERQSRSKEEQIKLLFVRIIINMLVVSILCAAGITIFYAFDFSMKMLHEFDDNQAENTTTSITNRILTYFSPMQQGINNDTNTKAESTEALPTSAPFTFDLLTQLEANGMDSTQSKVTKFTLEYLPSLCIVCLNIVLPIVFQNLIQFENYSPALMVRITLFRTVLLRLASLSVLLLQVHTVIYDREEDSDCYVSKKYDVKCWETYFGQQLYKLLLTDFAVQFVLTFFINFPRSLVARNAESKFVRMIGEQEFHLPKHVLDIVYFQTLCWLGAFYCPMLPIIATILCFLLFYVKKFACLVNSRPPSVIYRASRSNSLFMFVLLLSFCVAFIPVIYAIAEIVPSRGCGPFRGFNSVWDKVYSTFLAFPDVLQTIVLFIGTSAFELPAFIILTLLLYYYYAMTDANRHMVSVLKSQLVLEGHDKQFLLNRLSAFIRQQQKRSEKARQHHQHTNLEEDSIRHASSRSDSIAGRRPPL